MVNEVERHLVRPSPAITRSAYPARWIPARLTSTDAARRAVRVTPGRGTVLTGGQIIPSRIANATACARLRSWKRLTTSCSVFLMVRSE